MCLPISVQDIPHFAGKVWVSWKWHTIIVTQWEQTLYSHLAKQGAVHFSPRPYAQYRWATRLHFVFSREFFVAPQLWGNCTTVVGQLHHNCGAVAPQLWGNEYEAEKNNYLAGGNNYLGSPSWRLWGRFLLKTGGTECNFSVWNDSTRSLREY